MTSSARKLALLYATTTHLGSGSLPAVTTKPSTPLGDPVSLGPEDVTQNDGTPTPTPTATPSLHGRTLLLALRQI
jgi:hypothetical protein